MNIGTTYDPTRQQRTDPGTDPLSGSQASGETPPVAPALVQATRNEVRQITQEITELSQQHLPTETYFTQFL